jgi:hypothetical protein
VITSRTIRADRGLQVKAIQQKVVGTRTHKFLAVLHVVHLQKFLPPVHHRPLFRKPTRDKGCKAEDLVI